MVTAPRGHLVTLDLRRIGPAPQNKPDCFIWPRSCFSGGIGTSTLIGPGRPIQLENIDPGRYTLKVCLMIPGKACTHTGTARVRVGQLPRIVTVSLSRVGSGEKLLVDVRLRAWPETRSDGKLCADRPGEPAYGCLSTETFYRCSVTSRAMKKKSQRVYVVHGCNRQVIYELLAARLCADQSSMKQSEFAAGFVCGEFPQAKLPKAWGKVTVLTETTKPGRKP